MTFAKKLANISLNIGSISLNPLKPFKWASGYYMPIYNDNRTLLSDYSYRKLVTNGFKELISKNNIYFDIIAGTATAGIAPAASLAYSIGKSLVILNDNNFYKFDDGSINNILNKIKTKKCYDLVASTMPFSIIPGVLHANEMELPFAYIRENKKDHGKKQQIEGLVKTGLDILLISFENEGSVIEAVHALEEKGNKVIDIITLDSDLKPTDVRGARILQIEDLISTGGSCADEIKTYINCNAVVEHCLSIFNYNFDETKKKFYSINCKVNSILHYDKLIEIARKSGYIDEGSFKMLAEWRHDPFNWGKKHGFPREEKF